MKTKLLLLFVLGTFLSINAQDKVSKKSLKNATKIIMLKPDLTLKVGEIAYYSGSTHGSVGSSFSVDYDSVFFKEIEEKFEYNNPQKAKMTGGDSGVRTYYYKALKSGTFEFTVSDDFRGETKSTHTIKITISE